MKFPHEDSEAAVRHLSELLLLRKELLEKTTDETLSIEAQTGSNKFVSEALEMLGVIANSANVRNAFEVHKPISWLSNDVTGDKQTKLILTFEWDYQPYTVPQTHPQFPEFVIIGLPASEASNALVLPAVGHELGHVLWLKEDMPTKMPPRVNRAILDLLKSSHREQYEQLFHLSADQADEIESRATWGPAAEYALRQVEEIFCDFTGLFLFGSCFLDCFEYMLSPALHDVRDPKYPTVKSRAKFLADNCSGIKVQVRSGFVDQFADQKSPFDDTDKVILDRETELFELELADSVAKGMAETIAIEVFELCRSRGLNPPDLLQAQKILEQFLRGVPAERSGGLGPILYASWLAYGGESFMSGKPDRARMAALNELVLKTIEIFEIEGITSNAA